MACLTIPRQLASVLDGAGFFARIVSHSTTATVALVIDKSLLDLYCVYLIYTRLLKAALYGGSDNNVIHNQLIGMCILYFETLM